MPSPLARVQAVRQLHVILLVITIVFMLGYIVILFRCAGCRGVLGTGHLQTHDSHMRLASIKGAHAFATVQRLTWLPNAVPRFTHTSCSTLPIAFPGGRPYVRLLHEEPKGIAGMLSQLPPDVNVEETVKVVVLGLPPCPDARSASMIGAASVALPGYGMPSVGGPPMMVMMGQQFGGPAGGGLPGGGMPGPRTSQQQQPDRAWGGAGPFSRAAPGMY